MQEHNKIETIQLADRATTGRLEHRQLWEQKIFFQALQQFVDPINNPRYILHRQTDKRFFVRHDYHTIPDEIDQRKEHVELF